MTSTKKSLSLTLEITAADFFHENLPFGGMEITVAYRRFTHLTYDINMLRVVVIFVLLYKPLLPLLPFFFPLSDENIVCINTAVEFDRPWRCSFTLDSYLFALSMNAFATRTPSLVTIQARVHSCSNLYWALDQNLRGISYGTRPILLHATT